MAETVEIGSAAQLAAFRDRVNNGETALGAKLTADIDLSDLEGNWTPIGTQVIADGKVRADHSYNGMFDGGGMTVKGLTVTAAEAAKYVLFSDLWLLGGLFGATGEDAVIRDLTIEGAKIELSAPDTVRAAAGVLAGINQGQVMNCRIKNFVAVSANGGWGYASAVVASNRVSGRIIDCAVEGGAAIATNDYAGGVAAYNVGWISDCAVVGVAAIRGGVAAGGIAGFHETDGEIHGCTVAEVGSIVAESDRNCHGIVGIRYGMVENCVEVGR